MPPSAMMPPARMKNGIASSAKSSMPSDVLSITASSGKSDPERGDDGGDAERIGDRHAEQAEDVKLPMRTRMSMARPLLGADGG